MKITCKYCGIVSKPHKCPHNKVKWNKDNQRADKKVYRDIRWITLRNEVLDDYNNICLWSMYIDGEIVIANRVHHIIEVLDDESLSYYYDNLIPLEYYKHNYIHELYKANKLEIQGLLREMVESFRKGDKTLGKYKNIFKIISPPTI